MLTGCCPICSGIKTTYAFTAVDLNWKSQGSFPYIRCKDCGALFRPAGSTIPAGAYPWGYGSFVNPESHLLQSKIDSIANRRRAAFLESVCEPGTILDVGCGSGFFLAYLRSRGWEASGVETAVEHVAFARDRLGLSSVSAQAWPPKNGASQNYDAISMLHVIEHMPDPIASLNAARHSLCEQGVLLIETPNLRSWPARIFGPHWVTLDAPRHMVLFTPEALEHILRSTGFERIKTMTYSPSTMEWSESLRYSLDRMRRRRFGKAVTAGPLLDNVWQSDCGNKTHRERILGPVHTVERLIYRLINLVADSAGHGGNILVVASPERCRDNPL